MNNYTTERNDRKLQQNTLSNINKNSLQSKTRSDMEKSKSLSLLKTAKTSQAHAQAQVNKKNSQPVKLSNQVCSNLPLESEEDENIFSLGKTEDDLKNEYNQLKSLMANKVNKNSGKNNQDLEDMYETHKMKIKGKKF
jgi:hypothetical protein